MAENQTKSKRRLECDLKKHKKWRLRNIWKHFLFCALGALSSLLCYEYLNIVNNKPLCVDPIDPNAIVKSLKGKLYGQSEAVSMIQSALSFTHEKRILVFVGGTGQGKTLTARLIAETLNIPQEVLLLKDNYQDFIVKRHILRLNNCFNAFVILDDLMLDDIEDSVVLLKHVLNSYANIKNLVILLIYNIETLVDLTPYKNYTLAMDTINAHLDNFKMPTYFIKFYDLNRHHLQMCAKKSLEHFSMSSTKGNIRRLLKLTNYTNCKIIHSKAVLI